MSCQLPILSALIYIHNNGDHPKCVDRCQQEDVMHFIINRPAILLACLLMTVAFVPSVTKDVHAADSPEEAGLAIATEARESQKGFGDFTANLTMILRNKQGQESKRELRLKVLEVAQDGDKNLFVFDRPRDVKGTAFLVHTHRSEPDDQWLYLPALKRVKRISSSNQSGSFMGSEFSYEDMGTPEVEKFKYRLLRYEPCGNLECSVLERIPTNKDSGYSRQLVWQDRGEYRTMKVEYYDRRNAHLKTMVAEGYKKYLEKFWRGSKITMTNHLTGKSTELHWSDYKFGQNLKSGDFSQTALKRVR